MLRPGATQQMVTNVVIIFINSHFIKTIYSFPVPEEVENPSHRIGGGGGAYYHTNTLLKTELFKESIIQQYTKNWRKILQANFDFWRKKSLTFCHPPPPHPATPRNNPITTPCANTHWYQHTHKLTKKYPELKPTTIVVELSFSLLSSFKILHVSSKNSQGQFKELYQKIMWTNNLWIKELFHLQPFWTSQKSIFPHFPWLLTVRNNSCSCTQHGRLLPYRVTILFRGCSTDAHHHLHQVQQNAG